MSQYYSSKRNYWLYADRTNRAVNWLIFVLLLPHAVRTKCLKYVSLYPCLHSWTDCDIPCTIAAKFHLCADFAALYRHFSLFVQERQGRLLRFEFLDHHCSRWPHVLVRGLHLRLLLHQIRRARILRRHYSGIHVSILCCHSQILPTKGKKY